MSNGISRCQEADHDALVSYVYDELTGQDRARLDAHLAVCGGCREELDEMRGVRGQLATWTVPPRELGFAIVSATEHRRVDLRRWTLAAGLAAAAVLVLAAAAAIANLDIRYDREGLSVRTGWSRTQTETGSVTAPAPEARPSAAAAAETGRPWRDDLAALERRLTAEFASIATPVPSSVTLRSAGDQTASNAELLRRVRALIEQSELRQQRELALRVAQLARDFDSQRQTDLVRIQQGLGQLEGSSAVDRQLLNYLVRVSQRQ